MIYFIFYFTLPPLRELPWLYMIIALYYIYNNKVIVKYIFINCFPTLDLEYSSITHFVCLLNQNTWFSLRLQTSRTEIGASNKRDIQNVNCWGYSRTRKKLRWNGTCAFFLRLTETDEMHPVTTCNLCLTLDAFESFKCDGYELWDLIEIAHTLILHFLYHTHLLETAYKNA